MAHYYELLPTKFLDNSQPKSKNNEDRHFNKQLRMKILKKKTK